MKQAWIVASLVLGASVTITVRPTAAAESAFPSYAREDVIRVCLSGYGVENSSVPRLSRAGSEGPGLARAEMGGYRRQLQGELCPAARERPHDQLFPPRPLRPARRRRRKTPPRRMNEPPRRRSDRYLSRSASDRICCRGENR